MRQNALLKLLVMGAAFAFTAESGLAQGPNGNAERPVGGPAASAADRVQGQINQRAQAQVQQRLQAQSQANPKLLNRGTTVVAHKPMVESIHRTASH